jgi:hypothetical protein
VSIMALGVLFSTTPCTLLTDRATNMMTVPLA